MKKLTKTIWYGSGVDMNGQPIIPRPANGADDLGGLHLGELFLHLSDKVTLWTLSESGEVVCISGNEQEIDLTGYLLKSVWDSVFEIRNDSNGREFLFGKLPFATQYGIISYANVGNLNIPNIYDGLPIDWSTIYWEEVTNADGTKTRVLKARGGSGEGGGNSNIQIVTALPSNPVEGTLYVLI